MSWRQNFGQLQPRAAGWGSGTLVFRQNQGLPFLLVAGSQCKSKQSSAVIADPDAMRAIKHELFLTTDCRLYFSEFEAVPLS